MTDSVAIVVLNYNGQNFLKKFLPPLQEHSKPYRIIVADNASTDNSIHLLQTEFKEVEVIQLQENRGFAGGYNEALSQVDSKYYILINSDVEVTEGWAIKLISYLEEHPSHAACQPKIKSFKEQNKFEYAGAAGGFVDFLGYPLCRGRIFNHTEEDHQQYDEIIDIFWASGACFAIRSEVFHNAGGFDEDFFAHMEEIDLCWRINSLGLKIACIPESTVYHVGGGTLAKSNPKKTYLNFRNSLAVITKNLPLYQLIWKLPARLILDIVAAFVFLFNDSTGHFRAVGGAVRDFVITLPSTLRKRKGITRNLNKLHSKSIVVQYFLLKKTKFSEL